MKKLYFSLILLCVFSASYGNSNTLKAYLSHAAFYSPESGPYLETYLSILGKSVNFVRNDNGKFQGVVRVTMLFKQNDSIKNFRKYDLHTIEVEDTSHINFIVFDQQRIAIPEGKYELELELADKNSDKPAFKAKDELTLNFKPNEIKISDIELVESFTQASEASPMAKSGYDFIPYQDYYYPKSINTITFYAEIYNTDVQFGPDAQFVVALSIQSFETGRSLDNYFRIKRETSNNVNVVFSEFDISALASGKYNLAISIRDRENKEVTSKSIFFQRSNPGIKFNTSSLQDVAVENSFVARLNQPDTLREFTRMCSPIASANEKMFIEFNLSTGSLLTLQQYFLNFWLHRDPADPEGAWLKYYNTVLGVEQAFRTTNKRGYETDRGRVYLQYGPPNDRIRETMNPDSYPYEIWHYYQIANQSNMRFVFYTRDMALNDFVILHSTVLGEIKNVTWQYDIRRSQHDKRPTDTDNSLYTSPYQESNMGEHTEEYFNNRR